MSIKIPQNGLLKQCICHNVRLAARAVTRTYDAELSSTGLRSTQFAVMVAISECKNLSISALSETIGMDRSTLTRNLRPLEKAGFVRLGPEGWKRSRSIELTSPGRKALATCFPLWRKAQQKLDSRIGPDKIQLIRSQLEGLAMSLR